MEWMRRRTGSRKGPVNVNDMLRLLMAVVGVLLILALGKLWFVNDEASVDWKELLGSGFAKALYYLNPEAGWQEEKSRLGSVPRGDSLGDMLGDLLVFGDPFASFGGEGEKEAAGELDPAYEEYRYFLLYGDENSGASREQLEVGDSSFAEADFGEKESASLETEQAAEDRLPAITGKAYAMEQLMDYDFLMKHFYNVHSSTTARREEMNAKELLSVDLTMEKKEEPQILVYHTHSQETFADYGPSNQEADIVSVGAYLTELLRAKGYQVIHDTSQYDMMDGKLDRNHAYNYALEGISRILQEHPSIQVILDIHRDGVDEELHLVNQVNGKATAPVMFFNGMSQTPEGPIEYLQNPYKKENLAFSLKLQLNAAAYYPGYTRKIYLKGLRYNLHLRPRSALVEVGAQTNTLSEAKNAMEPLAELLDLVLKGEGINNS